MASESGMVSNNLSDSSSGSSMELTVITPDQFGHYSGTVYGSIHRRSTIRDSESYHQSTILVSPSSITNDEYPEESEEQEPINLHFEGSFSKNIKHKGKLGQGAYGQVFHCINMDSGEEFAVKYGMYETDESDRESFQNEIAVLKKLDHPNIVRYFGSHIQHDRIGIFMELVEGGSVYALIKKFGPLNNELSKTFLKKILRGLSYLHKQNVVHRDLKAANILKAKDGSIKIADFGLSKIVESVKSSHITSKRGGTPLWMAPELIKNNSFTDRVDIWGIGVTAFEFLQGNPPFQDLPNSFAIMFQIARGGTWEKCRENFPSAVSDDLRDFVMKCVQEEPKDRPSAEQLLEHRLFIDSSG